MQDLIYSAIYIYIYQPSLFIDKHEEEITCLLRRRGGTPCLARYKLCVSMQTLINSLGGPNLRTDGLRVSVFDIYNTQTEYRVIDKVCAI